VTSNPNIDIRRLSDMDAEDFYALRARGLRLHPEAFGEDLTEFLSKPVEEISRRLKMTTGSFVVGAFAPGLAGCVGLYRGHALKTKHKAKIWGMYVDSSHRGRGIGKLLMLKAIANARTINGLEELMLSVVTTNIAAIGLYESLGFQTYGMEPRALKLDEGYWDEHLMRLSLLP